MSIHPKQLNLSKDVVMKGGRILLSAGTITSPSISFVAHPATGMFMSSSSLAVTVGSEYAFTVEPSGDLHMYGAGATALQSGDTSERPSAPIEGMIRYNSQTDLFEGYANSRWDSLVLGSDSRLAGGSLTLTGDVTGSGSGSIATTLATVNTTPGSYGSSTSVATFTVNGKGLVILSGSVPVAFPVTSVAGRTGAVTIASADITDATDANTASKVVRRDASGNFSAGTITASLNGNATSATTAASATKLSTARTIGFTGDATGSGSFDGSANLSISLTLGTVNTNTGTFNNVTVNGKGLVTAASNVGYLTANQTITLSGDVSGSGTTGITTTLANTTVSPASYGSSTSVATFTVDSKGRLTAAGSTAIAFPVTSVAGRTGAVTITSADVTDATANNTAGTLVKRDASGNFSAGTVTAALNGNAATATKLATVRTVTHTGDVTGSFSFDGSADVSGTLTLANVNANTGTFNTLTVNAKGLVTAASNTAYLTSNQTITISGDATGSGSTAIALTLANSGVTAGTYTNSAVTVNSKGLVTGIASGITQYRYYYADQFETPNSSDWSVNALAPAMNDATNAAIVIRAFDDTAEEGIGFTQGIPLNASNIVIRVRGRSAVAANSGGVVFRLHIRTLVQQTPAAITAWSITTLPTMTVPNNAFFQTYSNTYSFASLGLSPQSVVQFELTRQGSNAADTLSGDFNLLELAVAFN